VPAPARHLVLLSGGLDSTVCMAVAGRDSSQPPVALTFDYGQRHRTELDRAAAVAARFKSEHLIVELDASRWGGSALTDATVEVPDAAEPNEPGAQGEQAIPVTYVPARNIIFLSVALGVAEARDLDAVYLGVNALDYSGYPDCRPEFVEAFRGVAAVGQKRGVEGRPVDIRTPLIELTKAGIVRLGTDLGAPLELTWSCYRAGPAPCGRCDACVLRAKGFSEAGLDDPALATPTATR
jgi:7-cyano-7-deazaguanine synthase